MKVGGGKKEEKKKDEVNYERKFLERAHPILFIQRQGQSQ
jgi:hypothetical protein